jgi:hypothetical protein
MELYRGTERSYIYGKREGAKRDEAKNKGEFVKGTVSTERGKLTLELVLEHLRGGAAMVGLAPLKDDGMVENGCVDVDQVGKNSRKYEFDYYDEMDTIRKSGFPVVVRRSKSSGFRVELFCEATEADVMVRVLRGFAARLGYAGCEIFPKQTKLEGPDDCPSALWLPYGPMWDLFAEQCGMSETGNPMTLEEWLDWAESKRISRDDMLRWDAEFARGQPGKSNGSGTHKGNSTGKWGPIRNGNGEVDIAATKRDTFRNGPPCMYTLANQIDDGVRYQQHDFLFAAITLLKRKYPDNWDEVIGFVNDYVLVGPGDRDKLKAMIRDHERKDYEYRCKDEPIVSYCNPYACRRMPYGVGNGVLNWTDLGMTIVNRVPRIFYINIGNTRICLEFGELINLKKLRVKLGEAGANFPDMMKQQDWDKIVREAIEGATVVEPSEMLQSDADHIEVLEDWFRRHIPSMVWAKGKEFLSGDVGEEVRVRVDEARIYFKPKLLVWFFRKAYNNNKRELQGFKLFLEQNTEHSGEGGPGIRDWFRHTRSVPFSMFNEEEVHRWLNPDEQYGRVA